jgi:Zn-dependent peptidase ImmA (M78 family)
VGQIESGERGVSPEELVRLGEYFDVAVSYFTDRFEPTQRIAFSFRASSDDPIARANFEGRAARWLTLFTELGREQRVANRFVRPTLGLSEASSYEDAQAAADEVAREFQMGDAPGVRLSELLDHGTGVLLLHVDAPGSISGAAADLDQFGAILINRRDPAGRRNFDIAHELFHLLTWDRMPPPELEMVDRDDPGSGGVHAGGRRPRREQLADNFASALLMPATAVARLWSEAVTRPELASEAVVASMAHRFRVSAPAVAWRLHNLGLVDRTELPPDAELSEAVTAEPWARHPPALFSREFVDRVRLALEGGTLSFRRAARILDLDSSGLVELFRSYGMPSPYEA